MANIVLPDEGWAQAVQLLVFTMVLLAIIAIVAAQKPVLFRMGVRNASRRPAQTSLVIGGLMIGTAILSGAFVTGDTMEFAIVKDTYAGADLLDELVQVPGGLTFNYSVYDNISSNARLKAITDGISPEMMLTGVTIFDNSTGQLEPNIVIQGMDPVIDRPFGEFTTTSGEKIDGSDLSGNSVIINHRMASALSAKVGDVLEVYYIAPIPASGGHPGPGAGTTIQLSLTTVKHIVNDDGKANYNSGETVFMTLGQAQTLVNATGRINAIKVSNNGGVVDSVGGTNEAKAILQDIFKTLGPGAGAEPGQFTVVTVKRAAVDIAKASSKSIQDFLVLASSFTVVAGVLLIINIFVMLAEERKRELGISRAVGMRRAHLVRSFMFEGVLYAVLASAIGAILGILVAYVMARGIFNAVGVSTLDVPFYWRNSSILKAFSMGFLITLGTVALASWRVSNLNIVRAVRSIEEPTKTKGTKRDLAMGIGMLIFGVLLSIGGFAPGGSGLLRLLGVNLLLFGIAFTIRQWTGPQVAYTFGGLAVLIYSLYFMLYGSVSESESVTALVAMGLLMVFGAVLAIVSNANVMVRGLRGIFGVTPKGRAVVEVAVAHPLNKGFRTGMTVSMFSLILFIVVLFSIFFSVFTPNLAKQGGGYDLMATSSVPVMDLHNLSFGGGGGGLPVKYNTLNDKVDYVDSMAMYTFWGNFYLNTTEVPTYGPPFHYMIGVDSNFTMHEKYTMKDRDKKYPTDADAWAAVMKDPDLAVIDSTSTGTNVPIHVGDVVSLPPYSGANRTKGYRIAAILDELLFQGLFVNRDGLFRDFKEVRGNNVFLMKVKSGEDQKQVAHSLESDFKILGFNVIVVADALKAYTQAENNIFQLFEMYMSLGLVIGIAALGVISVRAVIERKQEIGIMRAIGYRRSMVLGTFVIEMMFITLLGIVIGVGIGWLAGYGIWKASMESLGVAFTVPWDRIGLTIGVTLVAALLCTILPAYKASRTNPADAVRWLG